LRLPYARLELFNIFEPRYCTGALDTIHTVSSNVERRLMFGAGFGAAVVAAAMIMLDAPITSAGAQEFNLVIRDHKFEPEQIRVPAGKRISLHVANEDSTPEEFDSAALKVEKVIAGKSKAVVRIGPLDPGRYEFIGEFHADTAKGIVIAE
jgi:hypothetical protein